MLKSLLQTSNLRKREREVVRSGSHRVPRVLGLPDASASLVPSGKILRNIRYLTGGCAQVRRPRRALLRHPAVPENQCVISQSVWGHTRARERGKFHSFLHSFPVMEVSVRLGLRRPRRRPAFRGRGGEGGSAEGGGEFSPRFSFWQINKENITQSS